MDNPRLNWRFFVFTALALTSIVMLSLTGCATDRVAIEPHNSSSAHEQALLQQARQYFKEENYNDALPLLKHLSKRKNSDAQYALGYMYYYGIGVSRDENTALNWMRLSASKNNQRAILALERFRQSTDLPSGSGQ